MQQTTARSESPSSIRVWLTATQVGERYGVSIPTVWTWAREGRLPQPHKLAGDFASLTRTTTNKPSAPPMSRRSGRGSRREITHSKT